jgi:hypothetical protein
MRHIEVYSNIYNSHNFQTICTPKIKTPGNRKAMSRVAAAINSICGKFIILAKIVILGRGGTKYEKNNNG